MYHNYATKCVLNYFVTDAETRRLKETEIHLRCGYFIDSRMR